MSGPLLRRLCGWPDDCNRWPRAVPVGPVLSHELCAIFVCIFNLYITVFMLQLYLSENCRNLPFFPWHILALRSEYSFHLCVYIRSCTCFIQNCEYLFTSTSTSQESLEWCVHMCACVHTHTGDGDQASREAAYSRVRRPVLCTLPVRNPGEPSSTSAESS